MSTIEGIDEMNRTFRRIAANVPGQAEQALMAEAEIFAEQARERVPVDEGDLRDSIHVEGPTRSGREISVEIVAGGPSAPHGVIVHEDMEAQHATGEAKFLERPVFEGSRSLLRQLGNRFDLRKVAR